MLPPMCTKAYYAPRPGPLLPIESREAGSHTLLTWLAYLRAYWAVPLDRVPLLRLPKPDQRSGRRRGRPPTQSQNGDRISNSPSR